MDGCSSYVTWISAASPREPCSDLSKPSRFRPGDNDSACYRQIFSFSFSQPRGIQFADCQLFVAWLDRKDKTRFVRGFIPTSRSFTQCFNAFGKPIPPLIISISQMLVLYVPLALVGDHFWGYVGIFAAAALTNSVLGVASWFWINRVVDQGMLTRAAN